MVPSNNHLNKDHRHYKIFKHRTTKERIGYIDFIGYEYLWRCRVYNNTKRQFTEEIIVKARVYNQVFIRLKNRFFIKKDESWVVNRVKKVTPINYFSKPSIFDTSIQIIKKREARKIRRKLWSDNQKEKNTNNKTEKADT